MKARILALLLCLTPLSQRPFTAGLTKVAKYIFRINSQRTTLLRKIYRGSCAPSTTIPALLKPKSSRLFSREKHLKKNRLTPDKRLSRKNSIYISKGTARKHATSSVYCVAGLLSKIAKAMKSSLAKRNDNNGQNSWHNKSRSIARSHLHLNPEET